MLALLAPLLLSSLTGTSAAAPSPIPEDAMPVEVLLWSDSDSREDAVRNMNSLGAVRRLVDRGLRFPEGYPRLQESREIPGMKKGRWYVVLGICHPVPKPVLEFIKSVRPNARAQAAEISLGMDICPETLPEAPKLLKTELLFKDRRVSVFEAQTASSSEDGASSSTLTFMLAERKSGRLLHEKEVPANEKERAGEGPNGAEFRTCNAVMKNQLSSIRVTRSCRDERTGCVGTETTVAKRYVEEIEVTIQKDKLVAAKSRKVLERAECIGAPVHIE